MLSHEQLACLPTDQDVAFYREHGWYRSTRLFADKVLDEAMRASERHFSGERDWRLPLESGFSDWKPTDREVIKNGQATAHQNRALRRLALDPVLGAIAARLTDSRVIRYFDDSILYKPPEPATNETAVGWHTDLAYWGTCTSRKMITAWIPFQDTTESMGPVVYIDRSHVWPDPEGLRTFHNKDLADVERRFESASRGAERIPMTLSRGEVSFHCCTIVHGSGANASQIPRVAMAVHMQDDSNRFHHSLDTVGRPWRLFNDQLARRLENGDPDYTDPDVFPVMWQAC